MNNYIVSRIEIYRNETLVCLDNNDTVGALKNRAVQKELENILHFLLQFDLCNIEPGEDFYDTSQVAKILKTDTSTANRKTKILNAFKMDGKWNFPKQKVDEYAIYYANINRRGRKKKELKNQE